MSRQYAIGSAQWSALILCLLPAYCLLGCSSNNPPSTQPSSVRERQDAVLKDPFGYSPGAGRSEDVSGGEINELDRKAIRKDLDHVLNP
jgi:hypothetical protein